MSDVPFSFPYFSMSPNRAIPTENSIRSSSLAAVGPLIILSRPQALNASDSTRACPMAISRNACSLLAVPDFREFTQAVRYGVLASGKLWEGGRDLNSETFRVLVQREWDRPPRSLS